MSKKELTVKEAASAVARRLCEALEKNKYRVSLAEVKSIPSHYIEADEPDPDLAEPCNHIWRGAFDDECSQCTLCGAFDC